MQAHRHLFILSYCIMESELNLNASINSVKHDWITHVPVKCKSTTEGVLKETELCVLLPGETKTECLLKYICVHVCVQMSLCACIVS